MRILVTTPYFLPVIGGSQNYILSLYSALRKIDNSIEVDIICYNTSHAPSEERIEGLNIFRVPSLEILPGQFAIPNYWLLLKLVRKLSKKNTYDVVNAHTRFFDNALWSPLLGKYLKAPSILTDHCADHPRHPNKIVELIARANDFVFFKTWIHFYTAVTVVSSATKDFFQRHSNIKTTIITGGVNDELFLNSQFSLTEKLKFLQHKSGNTIISFVARFIPEKGVQHFLTAAENLSKNDPSLIFVIAGDGPLLKSISPQSTNCIPIGQLSQQEVVALLKRTDIFVHPSSHSEGLPLVVLEAGACGCQVIATPTGELSSVLAEGRGRFCESNAQSIEFAIKCEIDASHNRNNRLKEYIKRNYNYTTSAEKYQKLLVSIKSAIH